MESKNRIIVLFFLLIIVNSCKHDSNKPPVGIIPKDSMVSIIADLHLADAVLLNANVQSKISDISSNRLYKTVLDKYGITRERFNRSIDFYAENPVVLDSMYDKVIEKLSLIESKGYNDSLLVK